MLTDERHIDEIKRTVANQITATMTLTKIKEIEESHDLLEEAWGIIANASDWRDNPEWVKVAEAWREKYFKTVGIHKQSVGILKQVMERVVEKI